MEEAGATNVQTPCRYACVTSKLSQGDLRTRDDSANRSCDDGAARFRVQDKFSASRLADALHALCVAACKETKDLMWKSEHMGFYLVFLDCLERLGEEASGPSNNNDGSVAMDVDPPAKRQRTEGVPWWFDVMRNNVLMKRDGSFVSASALRSAAES